jgi:hypothetical protein
MRISGSRVSNGLGIVGNDVNMLTRNVQVPRSTLSTICLDEKEMSLTARTVVREATMGASASVKLETRRPVRWRSLEIWMYEKSSVWIG